MTRIAVQMIERDAWFANPQALASVSKRRTVTGNPDLLQTGADPDTWLTPVWILSELGGFDLDPCAYAGSPSRVSKAYFTVDQDGLNQIWTGRVFMNPPFSNTAKWLEKHALHCNGISLVPASVESQVWRKYVWSAAKGILLLTGRTRFCNPDGSTTTGRPLRSIALIAWTHYDAFILSKSAIAGVFLKDWNAR